MIHEPLAPVKTAELSDGAQFYTQILSDLEDAIRILPARQTGSDYGRMSASAAKHLRALVYLTRGYESYADSRDFENAYKDAVDVINNSGHKLLEDFQWYIANPMKLMMKSYLVWDFLQVPTIM